MHTCLHCSDGCGTACLSSSLPASFSPLSRCSTALWAGAFLCWGDFPTWRSFNLPSPHTFTTPLPHVCPPCHHAISPALFHLPSLPLCFLLWHGCVIVFAFAPCPHFASVFLHLQGGLCTHCLPFFAMGGMEEERRENLYVCEKGRTSYANTPCFFLFLHYTPSQTKLSI